MTSKLNNFTYKSFRNYTGPIDDFRSKNIIFGYNGCGKSSLVKGLKDDFFKDPNNTLENLRVYSADYINGTLLLEPNNRRNIKGIKAVFGEKNIGIEGSIKLLESKIVDKAIIQNISNESIKLESEIRSEISKFLNSKKGSLRIPAKSSNLTIEDTIEAYKEDLKNALKVEKDKDLIEKTTGDDTLEKRIESLRGLDSLKEIDLSKIDLTKMNQVQEQNYDDIQIPNSTIIRWLKEGLTIHDGKTRCEFCGSKIDFPSINEKVDTYSKNIKFEAESFLKKSHDVLSDDLDNIMQIIKKRSIYIAHLNSLENLFTTTERKLIEIDKVLKIIKNNSEKISELTKIDLNQFKSDLMILNASIVKINNIIKDSILNEQGKLDKLNILVKGAISISISKSTLINNNMKKISSNEDQVLKFTKNNQENNLKIKELIESKVVTVDFMQLVNHILEDLNISIKLGIDRNDYILRTTLLDKNELTIDDISEGEKNLLSLLFFYFEMFKDKEQKFVKDDIKLIILDDPISSMDDSNRFYVLEIVKNILKLTVDQVFILSHVWDDYCQLIYGLKSFVEDSPYATYEIRKLEQSTINKNISKGNPYKFMFKEIYDLSLKSELSSDCEYFHLPNTIRKIFEEFLFFKTNGTIPQNSTKDKIESLFNITSNSAKTKLGTLLSVSNVLSHTNAKSNADILTAAKFLMRIIEENDKLHFDAMKL